MKTSFYKNENFILKYTLSFLLLAALIVTPFAIALDKSGLKNAEAMAKIVIRKKSETPVFIEGKRYDWILYENRSYTCARSGHPTFIIFTPKNDVVTTSAPLIIRFHGGGAGYWDENGMFKKTETFINSYGEEKLITYFKQGGVSKQIRARIPNARFLLPTMCDHDYYAGLGQVPDPGNPYSPDENGKTRTADGLRSSWDAISFTLSKYTTSHKFIYGNSAGSEGAFINFFYAVTQKGVAIDGLIMDSGVPDWRAWEIVNGKLANCGISHKEVRKRLGTFGADNNAAPLLLQRGMSRGLLNIPIYYIWSEGDQYGCGNQVITYIDPYDGIEKTTTGNDLVYGTFAKIITEQNPGGKSIARKACVDSTLGANNCGKHVPTQVNGLIDRNVIAETDLFHQDYNSDIVHWILSIIDNQQ
jgi:hypothetical protein